jgi:probable HAF family extracellular repeat protein
MGRSLVALAWLVTACGGGSGGPGGEPVPTYGIRFIDPTPAIRQLAAEQPGGGSVDDQIQAASADGSVLAGTSSAVMNSGDLLASEPFRYSEASGTVGLGTMPNNPFQQSRLISADGSTIVGVSNRPYLFRWTKDAGKQELGVLPDSSDSFAFDVSEDGSVIVGATQTQTVDGRTRDTRALRWANGNPTQIFADPTPFSVAALVRGAGSVILGTTGAAIFRWTEAGGVQMFDSMTGGSGDSYEVAGASTDGSIFAGTRTQGGATGQAFRYTPGQGMVDLEPMATYTLCAALKVSADGAVIAGFCDRVVGDVLDSEQAFRWTEATGMVGLGFLPGFPNSFPLCMSADGSVIVGNSGFDVDTAASFIWDRANGMRPMRALFEDDPVTKNGWTIDRGVCVSADGHVVFGEMQPRAGEVRAWVARLPPRS